VIQDISSGSQVQKLWKGKGQELMVSDNAHTYCEWCYMMPCCPYSNTLHTCGSYQRVPGWVHTMPCFMHPT
jgi:hypothetical protein